MVVSAIDNLVKGAAGQAVQNMNLMLGLSRNRGPAVKLLVKARRHAARFARTRATRWPRRSPRRAARGVEIVVVHGGGKQMTRYLAERGIESRFVNGLRVTTPETLDAVLKVFAGSVNHELVASLNRAGALAVGLTGIDALLVEAEQMDPALGAVGRVTQIQPRAAHLLVGQRLSCRWWRAWPATGRAASTTSMPTRWRWPAPRLSAPAA